MELVSDVKAVDVSEPLNHHHGQHPLQQARQDPARVCARLRPLLRQGLLPRASQLRPGPDGGLDWAPQQDGRPRLLQARPQCQRLGPLHVGGSLHTEGTAPIVARRKNTNSEQLEFIQFNWIRRCLCFFL